MYLVKALGAEAYRDFRVAYYYCDKLAGNLAAMRKTDYQQYKKKTATAPCYYAHSIR